MAFQMQTTYRAPMTRKPIQNEIKNEFINPDISLLEAIMLHSTRYYKESCTSTYGMETQLFMHLGGLSFMIFRPRKQFMPGYLASKGEKTSSD